MRIGALVPNAGPLPLERGIPSMAAQLDTDGYDSLWVSDHIVLPTVMASWYPFADDGRATWPSTLPYIDALVALALMAAVTEHATLGTAVLVLPLRQPVVTAKQAASIDVASRGRLRLGVGAGWLAEEFAALDVPFADRSGRLVEWMEILRDCWTGAPAARESARYTLPEGILCLPKPDREIPFLIGGHSRTALRRAGGLANGWLAQQALGAIDPEPLRAAATTMRTAADEAGRDPAALEIVLRIVESAGRAEEVSAALPSLAAAGVTEVIVNVDWDGDTARQLSVLREGVGG
jgi:probable F420-dependent oxidoreductase